MRRFTVFVIGLTAACLAYVYAEVEAVKIGYFIQKQEQVRVQALDRARALKYNIARLEAPHNLERKLQAQRIRLESPRQWQTLVVSGSQGLSRPQISPTSFFQGTHFFSRIFVGTAQAEAKESSRS